jgi:hypothetical protein
MTTIDTSDPAATATPTSRRAQAMRQGRQADSARRRQRVLTAIDQASASGTELSVSGIARAAGVDRTFIYRHRDLLDQLHAHAAAPTRTAPVGPAVTRASLQADLLAAHERAAPAGRPHPASRTTALRSPRPPSLARVRTRRPSRYRRS